MFLRNSWYVAAWAREVTRRLLARTLLGEPVVLFRKGNGEAVALYSQQNSVRVFYWVDSECGYAVASYDLGKDELARLARMAHDQLEK